MPFVAYYFIWLILSLQVPYYNNIFFRQPVPPQPAGNRNEDRWPPPHR